MMNTLNNYKYFMVDVFTEQPFHGVPLPVFADAGDLSDRQMQQISTELNASCTIFLQAIDKNNHREIRVFSKEKELPCSIHAIQAASYVLASTEVPAKNAHTLISFSSTLKGSEKIINSHVSKNDDGDIGIIQQSYNTHAAIDYYTPTTEELAEMLSLNPADIGFDNYRPLIVSCGIPYLIVPIMSYTAIREAKFNEAAWNNSSAPSSLAQEILLFANNTDDNSADFHARLLGPAFAHHEDPPIGSVIPAFASHICDHPHIQKGTHVFGIQRGDNNSRQSHFFIEMDNKQSKDLTIRVGGYAVLVGEGQIHV
jgi:trans-2,3-dihydro-3-hydroxyanthranilate isomerase